MIIGVLLIVCTFSFGCAASNSSSGFDHDNFIGELKIAYLFGNFINAEALSIDAFGNIYIADAGAPGIYKFDSQGDSIRGVIGFGREHNQFDGTADIDASLTNSIAVADRNNHRIEIYSKDLIWQATIAGHAAGSKIRFGYPLAVAAAPAGNYYIIDGENKRALSIQPDNGTQKVITVSGTESGAEMNPVSLAISGNEFITIADANSNSLIVFNNALLLQNRIKYIQAKDSKLYSSGNLIYTLDKNANVLRTFDAATLGYLGSYKLPQFPNQFLAFSVYKNTCYILTKEKVVVCSKN